MATTARPRGKAAGRAPVGRFRAASRATKAAYAQLNALSRRKGAKGSRGSKALTGGGGG